MYCYECLEKLNENEKEIFTCEKCKKKIHNKCLLYSIDNIKNLNIKECDTCRINIPENNFLKKKCSICDCDGSKLCLHKWLNVNKLNCVHQKCAKWFLKIDFELENNFIIFKSRKALPETVLLYDGKCHFCKKNKGNFFIKCKVDGCEIYTHEQCIYKHPLNYQFNGNYHFDFYCDNHKQYIKSKKIEMMKIENEILMNKNKENNYINNQICFQKNLEQKNNSNNFENIKIKNSNMNNNNISNINKNINKKEVIPNNFSKEKQYDFINTIHKCILCNIEIIFNNNKIDDIFYCKNCTSYYHINCINDYNTLTKNSNKNKCLICLTKQKSKRFQNKKCRICNYSNECNLIIEDIQLHFICIMAFSEYINFECKKFKNNFYKIKVDMICCICQKNGICYKCNKCGIYYHPFCAIKNHFSIKIKNNNFISLCNKYHKLFWNNKIKIRNFLIPSEINKIKTDDSLKSTSIISNKKFDNKIKKKKIKFKNRISLMSNNIIKKNEELITSLNYTYLKCLLREKKIYEPNLLNKIMCSDNKKLNWDISNNYFYDFTNEEFNTIFTEIKDNISEDNLIIQIDENIDNFNLKNPNDNKYTLVKINKFLNQNNNSFLALFNKSKLLKLQNNDNKMEIDDISKGKIIRYEIGSSSINDNKKIKELKFISQKRGELNYSLNQSNFNNINENDKTKFNILKKIKFLRGVKLNRLSKVILNIESQTNYPKENTYNFIEESIISKKKMLSIIKEKIKTIILKIKTEYEKDKLNMQNRKKNQIEFKNIINNYNSLKIFTKLSYHLINGIKIKTYRSIMDNIIIKNPEKKNISNIKEYIINQYKNDSECCICFDININIEEVIIFCDKCNASYHSTCYGIKDIKDISKELYYCDKCQYLLKNNYKEKEIKCLLCNCTHGALKFFSKLNNFAHITCILISDFFIFNDFTNLNSLNIIKDFKNYNFEKCDICNNNNGEVFKCNCCGKFYHFFCIYFDGGDIKIEKNKEKLRLNLIINRCKNDIEWNTNFRNEQIEVRKLIYIKQ